MKPVHALVLAALLLLPAACGFHPLYGSSSSSPAAGSEQQLASIRVDTIADRQGQKLRNYLIDDLQGEGVPPPPVYDLTISYSEAQADLGLNNDATTTRGQLTLSASFVLKRIDSGVGVFSGSDQKITAYNIQNSEFATILSRDDAEDRALRAIAEDLQLRLALHFRNVALHPPKADAEPKTQAVPPAAPALPGAPHAPGQVLDNQTPITQTQ